MCLVIGTGLSAMALGAASAQNPATVQVGGNATLGNFLVGPDGMTLYIFTNDTPGTSVCFDQCEVNWPPLTVPDGVQPTLGPGVAGTAGIFVRPDSSRQVTLDGQPLYYWFNDAQAGDATGHGVGNVWFVVAAASESEVVRVGSSASLGSVLTGPDDMTLYVFANDSAGTSVCYNQCAINWPPLLVSDGSTPTAAPGVNAGTLGTTLRDDGGTQVTLDGRPLYYWFNDSQPGDATGHGVGSVWFALDAQGVAYPLDVETPTSGPSPATPTTGASPAAPTTGSGTEPKSSGTGGWIYALAATLIAAAAIGLGAGVAARKRHR